MDKHFALFDMDGTLVDSMVYWESLAEEFLARKGIHPISQKLLDEIAPMSLSASCAYFQKIFSLPENPLEEMEAMMEGHYRRDIPLKPGVKEYLQALASKGVRMGVASASPALLVEDCLRRLSVLDIFEFVLSCDDVGHGKDSPEIFHDAARRWRVSPEEIAVYEDASYAIKTAKDAGYFVVAIYDESQATHWEALQAYADESLRDWRKSWEQV